MANPIPPYELCAIPPLKNVILLTITKLPTIPTANEIKIATIIEYCINSYCIASKILNSLKKYYDI